MSVSYRRLATALVAAVLAVTASVAYGQRIWVGGGRFYRIAPQVGHTRQLRRHLQLLPGVLHQRPPRRRRQRLGHRLSRRRQQLLRPARRAHVRARQARSRRPARLRRRAAHRSAARAMSVSALRGRRHGTLHRRGSRVASRLPVEGRLPHGRRLLGHPRVGSVGRGDQPRAAAAAGIRSPTSRRITRSCTRCTT